MQRIMHLKTTHPVAQASSASQRCFNAGGDACATDSATRTVFRLQQGAAAVEFAIIAMLFFTLLFGILEFGRLFYLINTVQEVTRHAAREAVVHWIDADSQDAVKTLALFGGAHPPGGGEITADDVQIEYLNADGDVVSNAPDSAGENVAECVSETVNCIAFVRVSIDGVSYEPMVGLFPFLSVPIPPSTVTMPAESLGYGQ